MLCITASAPSSCAVYEAGLRMSAACQVTELDQDGGVDDEVTEDHVGSPERLWNC
jgi:hypothetical protein